VLGTFTTRTDQLHLVRAELDSAGYVRGEKGASMLEVVGVLALPGRP
jgi:hypothetical protein